MKFGFGKLLMAAFVAVALGGTVAQAAQEATPAVMQYKAKPTSVRLVVMAGMTGAEGGFTVEWLKKSTYDALGGWPAAGDPAIVRGNFIGVPVWVTEGSSGDFTLPPAKWQALEMGELFDESGVLSSSTSELEPNTEYAVRVTAKASGSYTESAPSATLIVSTSVPVANCTYTQGFWKNHPEAWPGGATPMLLGTVAYTSAQLLAILNQPAAGNGLLILAHQLIAAKLSIASGADPTAAAAAIAAADALIGGLVVPPVGGGFVSPGSVNSIANTLNDYNNGLIGPGHCAVTPARVSTWGSIKSTYRR